MIFREINKKLKKNNFVGIKMRTKAEDTYTQTDISTLITTEKKFYHLSYAAPFDLLPEFPY